MMRNWLPACFVALFLLNQPAFGVVAVYTDRASFESAISVSAFFDFEDQLATPSSTSNLGNSVAFGDATVISTNSNGVFATNEFGAPTDQIASLNSGGLLIELEPGYVALGMDIGHIRIPEADIPGDLQFTLSDTSGVVYSAVNSVAENNNLGTPTTTFFGFISDSDDLVSLQLIQSGGSNLFETIDNLTYGAVAAVPESGVLMVFVGLTCCGINASARRRKASAVGR